VGLKELEPDQLWGTDPVHIRRNHMEHLVRGVNITMEKVSPKKRRENTAGERTAKRIRLEGEAASSGGGSQSGTGNSTDGSSRITARGGGGGGGGRGNLGGPNRDSGGGGSGAGRGYDYGGGMWHTGHNRSMSEQQQQYGRWRGGQQGGGRRW
jgi:ATP-dependent RNA helicase DeaD